MSSKFRHVGSPGGTICRAGQRLLSSILSAVTAGSVLLSVVPAVQAAPFETGQVIHEIISTDSLSVAEGLNYEQVTFKTADGSTVVGFMLDSNYGAEGSNLKIGVGMPYGDTEIGMQPVSGQLYDAFLNGRNVLGGVNGDFYDMSTGEPDGVYIQDGVQIHGWAESPITARVTYRTFFGILKDGTAIIGDE